MASTGAHRERTGDDRGAARERPPRADVPGSPLSAIARELGGATLVWVRERRGERFEAHLRSDGTLQLADGKIYLDPDAAARAAIGVERDVDGWRTWRVGEHGPTLAEAAAAAAG
jgi:Restriction Enzyme Adenine Methylase Associated